ncbi:unnamed protein product, partial [Brassica oleracea]
MNMSFYFFCPPSHLNVDRRVKFISFTVVLHPSPFTSVYVEFETVARFTWLTPLSPHLRSPCSNDVVMLGTKPRRCAHPCRRH